MANISVLSRLVNGIQRNVDLSANTLVVGVLKVGSTDLSETILGRLISLQNGSDVDATYHTHDSRYFTESELGSSTSSSGSDLIGDDNTYSYFTPAAATVKGALSGIDTAIGSISVSSVLDGSFRIKNTADNTKEIAFDASAIATGTTRTITMPNSNVDLGLVGTAIQRNGSVAFTANQPMGGFKLTGLAAGSGAGDSVRYEQAILASGVNAWSANQSLGGNKITNSADPSSGQDLVTLAYMNARLAGLKPKAAVRVASTADVDTGSDLQDGSVVDGVTLVAGDRVLLKNQGFPESNGIWVTAVSGSASRATDFDSVTPIDEINGAWVAVQEGTQAGQIWVQFGIVAVLNTDPINFEYFNPIAGLIGGDMITFAGSTFSVDLASASGLESTNPGNVAGQLRIKLEASNPSLKFSGSNELGVKFDAAGALLSGASGVAVQVDGSTIEINSNALRVKDAGITLAKLASNSVDENKIVSTSFNAAGAVTGGSGSKIAVQVDGSSIEINSNALRIKSGAYDQNTITGGSGSAAAVQSSPMSKRTFVAGESFAADTSFAVRLALDGETVGRVYKADNDASSLQLWAVIGIVKSVAGASAGDNIDVVMLGTAAQGANDTPYASSDVGKELFLGSAGAIILGSALTNAANEAQFCLGVVQSTTDVWVDFKQLRGIA